MVLVNTAKANGSERLCESFKKNYLKKKLIYFLTVTACKCEGTWYQLAV